MGLNNDLQGMCLFDGTSESVGMFSTSAVHLGLAVFSCGAAIRCGSLR